MVDRAIETFLALAADDACRVVVLTGAGAAFCSGMDLSERIEPDEVTFLRRVGQLSRLIKELHVPVIAKVRGSAVGFGANLALCADLVVADETAVFCEIYAERGLSIDGGGSWSVPRSVGIRLADGTERALGRIKHQLDASYAHSFADAVEAEAVGQAVAFRDKESREGARSFLEKRRADFRSC